MRHVKNIRRFCMVAAVSATALISIMGMDTAFAKTVLKGDLDGDIRVTLTDAQMALKGALKIVTLSEHQKVIADMDGDGQITLTDAQKILKCALRIEEPGTVEVDEEPVVTDKPIVSEEPMPTSPVESSKPSDVPTGTPNPTIPPVETPNLTNPPATDKPVMEHTLPCEYFEGCEEYFARFGYEVRVKQLTGAGFCDCGEPLHYDEYGNLLSQEEYNVKADNHYLQHFLNGDDAIGSVTSTRKMVFIKR